jgi:glycosyltransferase involved in cell wall biosynthesis
VRQPNRGLPKARNASCGLARGSLIALMDHDDLCMPERIEVQVRALQAHPEAVLCSSDFSAFDRNGPVSASHEATYYSMISDAPQGLSSLYPERGRIEVTLGGPKALRQAVVIDVHHGSIYPELAFGNFVHPPTALLRADVLRAVGAFDEDVPINCDWELFVRMARMGPFMHLGRALLDYRLSEGQLSSSRSGNPRLAVDLVSTATKIWNADPALRASHAGRIRQRRSEFCLDAADMLSEGRKGEATRMLGAALANGAFSPAALKVALKIVTPGPTLRFVRGLRARNTGPC